MSRGNKRLVVVLMAVVVMITIAVPLLWRPATLYWAKRKTWRSLEKLTPANRAALDAVPVTVALPKADIEPEGLEAFKIDAFVVRIPRPRSSEQKKANALIAVYPAYRILFLPPFSMATDDADVQRMRHQTVFEWYEAIYHTKPKDIDNQPDLQALSQYLLLLAEKMHRSGVALDTYFADFNEPDRHGFIMAVDPQRHRMHAEITMMPTDLCVGMYFESNSGVDTADILTFLAKMKLDADPAATLPRK